jgi:hypothetical protein
MALQRIAVINGRPSIWGDGAMGLVRASGLCEYVYEAIDGDGDHMVAVCRVKRKGEKNPIERTFSVADAKKAGLWGKAGTWQQYPKRMLQMRARAFALRDLFADVLGGLYIAEELEGLDEDRPIKDVTPRPVVRAQTKPDLPPQLPARAAAQPETAAEPAQAETQGAGKRPLPPLARTAKVTAAQENAAPTLNLNAPPADQPEAFREWIVAQVGDAKTRDALDALYSAHIAPNIEAEQILPPDMDDISAIFAKRRTELENQ